MPSLRVAEVRHARYYLEVLREVNDRYLSGGERIVSSLERFENEWPQIELAQSRVASNVTQDEAVAILCSSYSEAGTGLISWRRPPRQRLKWSEAALFASRRLEDRRAECRHLASIGSAQADLGETGHAIEIFRQALVLACELGELGAESVVQGHLGTALAALGDSHGAIDRFVQQLEIVRKISDRMGESSSLGNLGAAHFDLAAYLRAVEYFERRLVLARQLGDRRGEASILADLGRTCTALNEPRMAIAFYDKAIPLAQAIGDARLEAAMLASEGRASAFLMEHRIAKDFYRRAIDVFRDLGDRRGEGNSLLGMGGAYRELGEPNQAIELYHRALDIASDTGDLRFRAAVVDALSVAMHDLCESKHLDKERKGEEYPQEQWRGRMRDAIAMAERALELYEKTNDYQKTSTLKSRIISYDKELYPLAILSSLFWILASGGGLLLLISIRSIWISMRNQRSMLSSLAIGGRTSSMRLAGPAPFLLVQWIYSRIMKGLTRLRPRTFAEGG